ncbi:MAG: GGDEF domain-containing protein [Candidatus Contendobacter sp.]|nr:GGDEF domain-containing protein [Candidatus Contendobacter sp.]
MNEDDHHYLAAATIRIDKLLTAQGAKPLCPSGLSPELQAFAERFDHLLDALETLRRFTITLANGNLAHDAPLGVHLLDPLKHLQASLRHLTWQTQQVAAGDLDQHVDFLGEFSTAFNAMIEALRDKRAAEEKARYLSVHDSLTGLYNRAYFNEALDLLRETHHDPVSLLIADLDGLKTSNDTRGHLVGDLLIKKAAQVLQHGVRPDDVVARIGGDEFAVILHGADAEMAQVAITQIRATMDAYNQRDRVFPISISLGASTASHCQDLNETLRLADEAMYRDKIQRKGLARNTPPGLIPHR